ncbi:MAG TPA: 3-hydroxyacyl-CoA dehydrogenase family protein, partial [Phenylobacterium sp.]|nr:3-hydroxyacyl-CoA dehydrogenase family protein [Phenylobacterium sp.]
AKAIGKVAVAVGVCDGFVGNRILGAREAQARSLILEGASPQQVDGVLVRFGFPMGSFEMQDMSGGVELLWRMRQATGEVEPVGDRLAELGRFGQKAGRGYYRYGDDGRKPLPDPEVDAIIEEASRKAGLTRRAISDQEIEERLILPMINEGARILEEGVAARASDIDVIWSYGYGWPKAKGGPMYYADQIGLRRVIDGLEALQRAHGDAFAPSAFLRALADDGKRFADA